MTTSTSSNKTTKVPKLTKAERKLVKIINSQWDKSKALYELTTHLQVAATIELATIPIYLGTYYTIDRTPSNFEDSNRNFPKTDLSRFADKAGALIMSVAVEEMLHMSLASNVLYALGKDPELYLNAPNSYPANLPGHQQNVSSNTKHYSQNIPIPLARFSFSQLSHFLAIEYPSDCDAPPQAGNWDTIGQIYSYVRCIISSDWIDDCDFRVRQSNDSQIRATEYSPNNIDTVYPSSCFKKEHPIPAAEKHSAAKVAQYANDEDSHTGSSQLLTINTRKEALEAIATICDQGEGFAHTAFDDESHHELSHYYKFLELQSELTGYTNQYIKQGKKLQNNVAPLPKAPKPAKKQYSPSDLDLFVFSAPFNPVSSQFGEGKSQLVDIADGLFQYMLIMTETIYRIPSQKQKIYFNRTMHQSMIWVLDKFLQRLRTIKTDDGQFSLCATFANLDLGPRHEAFSNLCNMVTSFRKTYGKEKWYTDAQIDYVLTRIVELPDVKDYWPAATSNIPSYLDTPQQQQGIGTGTAKTKPKNNIIKEGVFAGTPKWPTSPPQNADLPKGAQRHACMGLNSCENQGRTGDNACAGQGFCSTALAYNASDPKKPSFSDHTCHVMNDCRNQGGCGLYGTQEELAIPGANDCQTLGSCATPINAERFITDGKLKGTGVWQQAREVFTDNVWPQLREQNPKLPEQPPQVPGSNLNKDLFKYGPTIEWIESEGGGMTACGASGMSGAGSCA